MTILKIAEVFQGTSFGESILMVLPKDGFENSAIIVKAATFFNHYFGDNNDQ